MLIITYLKPQEFQHINYLYSFSLSTIDMAQQAYMLAKWYQYYHYLAVVSSLNFICFATVDETYLFSTLSRRKLTTMLG